MRKKKKDKTENWNFKEAQEFKTEVNLKDKKGALYGFILGDCIGAPYENKIRDTFKCTDMVGGGTWKQPAGTWTDDTSLLLATMYSIKKKRKIDKEHLMKCYLAWFEKGLFAVDNYRFDIGNTTYRALDSQTPQGEKYDAGNAGFGICLGALLAGEYRPIEATKVLFINEEVISCCKQYLSFLNNCYKKDVDIPREDIRSSGYCIDTLSAALWAFNTTDSFEECILAAVNLGDDTDSVAALAGSIAGNYYGYDSIPKRWINKIRSRELIEACS